MKIDGYVACICEGAAEQAVMDLLLENDMLIFDKKNMLEEKIIRCRNAKEFENKYLKKGFAKKITVLRILDSRKENFKLSKAYENKVEVINIITAPEIEMLIIFSEDMYFEFKKNASRIKPSEFCKTKLKYKEVKNYQFVKEYFSDNNKLIYAIKEYGRVMNIRNGETTLSDLLK